MIFVYYLRSFSFWFVCFVFFIVRLSFAQDAYQYNESGISFNSKGMFREALDEFEKAYELDSKNEIVKKNLAYSYGNVGWSNIEDFKYQEAINSFYKALSLLSDEPEFYLGRGVAYFYLKSYYEAENEFEEVLKLDKKDFKARKYLGIIYYNQGDIAKAIEEWEGSFKNNPSDLELKQKLDKAKKEDQVESNFNKDRSPHFSIKFDGQRQEGISRKILSALEDAYVKICYDLNYYPTSDIGVILYSKEQFHDITHSPTWASGIYDGKIRIPVANLAKNPKLLSSVLYHEFTHVIVYLITEGKCPTWLNEGLAQYEEKRYVPEKKGATIKSFKGSGKFIPLSELEKSFLNFTKGEADLAYAESLLAVKFIVEKNGLYEIQKILSELSEGKTIEEAIKNVLYYKDYEDFQIELRLYIENNYQR